MEEVGGKGIERKDHVEGADLQEEEVMEEQVRLGVVRPRLPRLRRLGLHPRARKVCF